MKPRFTFSAALLLTCLILMNQACSAAEVSEEDFKALKDLVIQQGRRLDQLEQAHEGDQKALDQYQKIHAEVQFGKVDGSHSAFALADFAPIFLFRAHDNILFEAGFDVTLQNTSTPTSPTTSHDAGASTSVALTFGTIDYLFSDYSTFVGGLMLLPLGTYSERSAGWLNKIPDDPLPRDLLPGNGVGIQFRGAIPVGSPGQSLTYAIYGANG